MGSLADAVKIPIRNLGFQIPECTFGTHPGDSGFDVDHFTRRGLVTQHALEMVAFSFVLCRPETSILGINFEIPERLRKLHRKIDLPTLGPTGSAASAQNRVVVLGCQM